MTMPIKRVTLEVTDDQHRKLRQAAKKIDITQQDLMNLQRGGVDLSAL